MKSAASAGSNNKQRGKGIAFFTRMSFFWGSAEKEEEAEEPIRTYTPSEEETAIVLQVREQLALPEMRARYVIEDKIEGEKEGEAEGERGGETEEYLFTDMQILRFVRGRKRILDAAVEALIKHALWRKERKVEDITAEMVNEEITKNKVVTRGVAKDGRPTCWVLVRRHAKADRDLEIMYNFIIYSIEAIMRRVLPNDERFCLVFDLRAFGLSCMDYEVVKMLVGILQANYPETLDRAIIVDSPFIFSACWAIIKPWLDPVTVQKIIFSSVEDVGKYIDESQWPEEFSALE